METFTHVWIICICHLKQAFAETIRDEIAKFPAEDQDDVIILFSAHSLPMKVGKRCSINV